jgi:hypothetical protein
MILGLSAGHAMAANRGRARFVAVGISQVGAGPILGLSSMYSDDGILWLPSATAIPAGAWVAVAEHQGVFVATGISTATRSYRSTDGGNTWTASSTPLNSTYGWRRVAAGNGRILAFATFNGLASYSDDLGVTWSAPYSVPVVNAVYSGGQWVGVSTRFSYTSTDGVTWSGPNTITSDTNFNFVSNNPILTSANGGYIVVGNNSSSFAAYSSADGVSWTQGTGSGNFFLGVATERNRTVAIGIDNTNQSLGWTTVDNTNWTGPSTSFLSQPLSGLAAGAGRFVAVGDTAPSVYYTNNGQDWYTTSRAAGVTNRLSAITAGPTS